MKEEIYNFHVHEKEEEPAEFIVSELQQAKGRQPIETECWYQKDVVSCFYF